MKSFDRSDGDSGGKAPHPALYQFRFGSVEFDESRSELRVGGLIVDVEARPLQLLAELLRHVDEVVTRDELFEQIWAGRPTVDNVLPNAVAKLRKALGESDGARIVNLPRIGYRLNGPVERTAAGRRLVSRLELAAGQPVQSREHFLLERQLADTFGSEVWLARHAKTREPRVFKFAADGERLASLKREATLNRMLREGLGERQDFVQIHDWNFATPPFHLECAYAGDNLKDWAERDGRLAGFGERERVALFLQLADAVAAAHGQGVLHKDLKPANVLVASADASAAEDSAKHWQLRVTDFGSARLLDPERLAELGITRLGMTLTQNLDPDSSSGTPLYLAPELLAGQPPSVKSDLYALGLMLYQLLVGDFRKPLAPGWERAIADPLLREDIAAATEGDPAQRLASVAELCARLRSRDERIAAYQRRQDVERRAVEAERALERSRARRPLVFAAIAILLIGLAASLWFYAKSATSQHEVERQYRIARAVNDFIAQDLIGAANPSVSGRADLPVIEAARQALPRIDTAFADAPEVQAALHRAMLDAFAGLTESEAAIGEAGKAIAAYERVSPPDVPGLSEARIGMAFQLAKRAQYTEAKQLLDVVERDLPAFATQHPDTQIRYLEARSLLLDEQMDFKATIVLDRKAWALMQALPDASDVFRNRIQFNLADSLMLDGQHRESEALLRDLIARQARRWGERSAQALFTTVVLANNLLLQHRVDEATALLPGVIEGLNTALGPKHRRSLLAKMVLGNVYMDQLRWAAALPIVTEVYRGFAETSGGTSQGTLAQQANFGAAQLYTGDLKGAETTLRAALASARKVFDIDHPQVQAIRYSLVDCLLTQRRAEEAAPLLEGLKPEILEVSVRQSFWPGLLDYQAGRLALLRGDTAKAKPLIEKALRELDETGPLWGRMLRKRDGDLLT